MQRCSENYDHPKAKKIPFYANTSAKRMPSFPKYPKDVYKGSVRNLIIIVTCNRKNKNEGPFQGLFVH